MTPDQHIHPQLLQDSHHLGDLDSGALLLAREASLHWFILVPRTDVEDFLDLPEAQRQAVVDDAARISQFLKLHLGYAKVNLAALGNVVPQMHLHVLGRRTDDPCWPAPVWGRLATDRRYNRQSLAALQQQLARELRLRPHAEPGGAA